MIDDNIIIIMSVSLQYYSGSLYGYAVVKYTKGCLGVCNVPTLFHVLMNQYEPAGHYLICFDTMYCASE